MKYLALLVLIGFLFGARGLSETDSYSVSIEGPPPQDGLPELSYGKADHPVSASREILASRLPERSLIYKFRLPSGTYDHLRWTGHGVSLPPTLSVRDYWGREIAVLNTAGVGSADLVASPTHPLVLPSSGILSLSRWSLENGWAWVLAVLLFFALRTPLATATRNLLAWHADRSAVEQINARTILPSVIALGAVWLCFALPGAIRFDTGDDPAMELLACGDVTGHPSEYLIFINVLIGLLLKGLYLLAPPIPWYPLLLLTVVIFSLTGITSVVLQEDLPDRFCWLCLFGIVFGTYLITHLQFTSAAYLLGLLGVLIFTLKTSRVSLAMAIALVAAGSLIRFESFLLLLVTTSAAAWLLSKRPLRERAFFILTIVILGWAGQAFDHAYYDCQPEWRAYRAYNKSRGDLNMTAKLDYNDVNRPVYEHVGWSENDFKMLNVHWLYEDPAAFSADKLAYLDQHLTANRDSLGALLVIVVAVALAPAATLLFLTMLSFSTEKPRPPWLIYIAILGPALFMIVYLADTARLPTRVLVPILYASSLFLLIAVRRNGETCRRLASTVLLPLTFVTLTVLSAENVWKNATKNAATTARISSSLQLLVPSADNTLVSSINAVLLERLPPLTALAQTRNFHIIHLMWSGGSPSFETQLQRHGSASLFQSIAFDPHFWLMVPTSQWDRADSFSLYLQEHEHQKVKMTPVILSDGKPAVFPDFTVLHAERSDHP